MQAIKPVLGLVLLVAMVLSQTACPQGQKLAPYAEDFVESLSLSLPLLAPYPEIAQKAATTVNIGRQLVTALKSENGGDAGNIVESLISHFDQIVMEVNTLPVSQERKNQILLGLVGARIALGIIARNITKEVVAAAGPQPKRSTAVRISRIQEFSKRKNWRCRSSQSGRFAPMSFCKAHPDVSVVETY